MNGNAKYWMAVLLTLAIALAGLLIRDGVADAGCMRAWAEDNWTDCDTEGLW